MTQRAWAKLYQLQPGFTAALGWATWPRLFNTLCYVRPILGWSGCERHLSADCWIIQDEWPSVHLFLRGQVCAVNLHLPQAAVDLFYRFAATWAGWLWAELMRKMLAGVAQLDQNATCSKMPVKAVKCYRQKVCPISFKSASLCVNWPFTQWICEIQPKGFKDIPCGWTCLFLSE